MDDNQNKPKEPDPKPPERKRKWLSKRILRIVTAFGPIIVAVVALYLGYKQTQYTNDSNFDVKKYEISYADKKQAYLELMNRVYQIRDIKNDDGTKLDQANYISMKEELLNSAYGVSIYLSKINSNQLENECENLWLAKFNDNFAEFNNSLNYFKYDLKDMIFKN